MTLNLYTYTANNPLRYIDPSGHCFTEWLGKSYCQQAWDATVDYLSDSYDQLADIHSSWDTALDYWTMGGVSNFERLHEVGESEPFSAEHWMVSAEIFLSIIPMYRAEAKASQAVVDTVVNSRVGQWMSKYEYDDFAETGKIPRTNVLVKGKEGYEKQANAGDYYVEFDVDLSLLVDKDVDLGWALVKSNNNMYIKLAEKNGITLPAPYGKNIEHVYTKPKP